MIEALLYTFFSGLAFLVGIFLLNKTKNREKMALFTISIAFAVMISLTIFDLVPELLESHNMLMILPVIVGFLLLYFLDKKIPHHHHEHKAVNDNIKEHNEHLNHIGIVTIIALTLHNMIEGMTLYNLTIQNGHMGLLLFISVALHNIPLGFQVGGCIDHSLKSKLLVLVLVLSALIGGLIITLFGYPNEIILLIILALTLGMILYIIIFELFAEIKNSLKTKEAICGIITGGLIFYLTTLL